MKILLSAKSGPFMEVGSCPRALPDSKFEALETLLEPGHRLPFPLTLSVLRGELLEIFANELRERRVPINRYLPDFTDDMVVDGERNVPFHDLSIIREPHNKCNTYVKALSV